MGRWGYLDWVLRYAGFLLAPGFFALSISLGEADVAVFLVVFLVIVAFIGSAEAFLERFPALGRMRWVGGALRLSHAFHEHYRQHRPRPVWVYWVYPVYAIVGSLTSQSVRKEIRLHLQVLGAIVALLLVDAFSDYIRVHRDYLSPLDSATILLSQFVVMLFLVLGYMMPMTTTAYMLDLSGRRTTVRAMVLLSLVLSIPVVTAVYIHASQTVSLHSRAVLRARMRKPEFRRDLREFSSMFLDHWATKDVQLPKVGEVPIEDPQLTKDFRRLLSGMMPSDEPNAFRVMAFLPPKTHGRPWLALSMSVDAKTAVFLLIVDPDGKEFRASAHLRKTLKLLNQQEQDSQSFIDAMMAPAAEWDLYSAVEQVEGGDDATLPMVHPGGSSSHSARSKSSR